MLIDDLAYYTRGLFWRSRNDLTTAYTYRRCDLCNYTNIGSVSALKDFVCVGMMENSTCRTEMRRSRPQFYALCLGQFLVERGAYTIGFCSTECKSDVRDSWISSQARTQFPQVIHLFGSRTIDGEMKSSSCCSLVFWKRTVLTPRRCASSWRRTHRS